MSDIKSSAKKLVINNLCRIFGDSITFVGSICEVFYLHRPLSTIKDIDIKVNISNRSHFLNKLLTSDFIVYSEDKRIYTVKPFRTYEPIRNFGTHNSSYTSDNQPSFKYGYHMHIFGVPLDICFYIDTYSDLKKYIRFANFPPIDTIYPNTRLIKTADSKFCLQAVESRMEILSNSIADCKYPLETHQKHLKRLSLYDNYDIVSENAIKNSKYTNLLNSVPNFFLPKKFDTNQYKKNNYNLKPLITKDSLIDHYIAHGIFENAVVQKT